MQRKLTAGALIFVVFCILFTVLNKILYPANASEIEIRDESSYKIILEKALVNDDEMIAVTLENIPKELLEHEWEYAFSNEWTETRTPSGNAPFAITIETENSFITFLPNQYSPENDCYIYGNYSDFMQNSSDFNSAFPAVYSAKNDPDTTQFPCQKIEYNNTFSFVAYIAPESELAEDFLFSRDVFVSAYVELLEFGMNLDTFDTVQSTREICVASDGTIIDEPQFDDSGKLIENRGNDIHFKERVTVVNKLPKVEESEPESSSTSSSSTSKPEQSTSQSSSASSSTANSTSSSAQTLPEISLPEFSIPDVNFSDWSIPEFSFPNTSHPNSTTSNSDVSNESEPPEISSNAGSSTSSKSADTHEPSVPETFTGDDNSSENPKPENNGGGSGMNNMQSSSQNNSGANIETNVLNYEVIIPKVSSTKGIDGNNLNKILFDEAGQTWAQVDRIIFTSNSLFSVQYTGVDGKTHTLGADEQRADDGSIWSTEWTLETSRMSRKKNYVKLISKDGAAEIRARIFLKPQGEYSFVYDEESHRNYPTAIVITAMVIAALLAAVVTARGKGE